MALLLRGSRLHFFPVYRFALALLLLNSAALLTYLAGRTQTLVTHFGVGKGAIPGGSIVLRSPGRSPPHADAYFLASAAPAGPKGDGRFARPQRLKGVVLRDDARVGSLEGEISSEIVWSLVRSFSPEVNDRVSSIFRDDFDECKFFAIIPAIARRNGEVLLVQRIWLAQYEYRKRELRRQRKDMGGLTKGWKNTWQENFLYHVRMNENYEAIEPGELLGVPTTTNAMFSYKSDGAMDPRLVEVGDNLLLLFHSWMFDKDSHDEVGGRVQIWNWDKRHKRKLKVEGVKLQHTEINWIPMDVNGSLYLTYSLDPLRVMKCDVNTGACFFVHEQEKNRTFSFTADHLRGGTPFIVYKYPYYIGVGHSVGCTYSPYLDFSVYSTHIVVLHVGKPWRIVYVSANVEADAAWLKSKPVVRNHTIIGEFWYPMGIVKWSDDVIDVSCHLNDYDGHVVRLRGMHSLMDNVIRADTENIVSGATLQGPRTRRVVQQYVLESLKQRMPDFTFQADLMLNTPE